MLVVTLERDDVVNGGFVKIGGVARAIAVAMGSSNLQDAERKLFARVNAGVQSGLLVPLDPEHMSPLRHDEYGTGIVPFAELVKWGHATKLWAFQSEFVLPDAIAWADTAPSLRAIAQPVSSTASLPPNMVTQETRAPSLETAARAPAPVVTRVHRTSDKNFRRDLLTPVIEIAQSQCQDPSDTAAVWAVLQFLAAEKHPPLIGVTEDGLQYRKSGEVAYLNRKALDKRLHPDKRGAAAKGR